MAQAIRITEAGGPEVLRLDEVDAGAPGAGEALIRQTAIGINFVDIYYRTGLYKQPAYPCGIGQEAAGVVEKVGEGVSYLKAGDRVVYCGGPPGAYATQRVLPVKHIVKIPDGVNDDIAAACILKGLTAQFLLRRTFPVKKGDMVLIHAGAGGVGLIACQWAKHLGATVIGTVGSDEKAALAKEYGCDYPIVYTRDNFVEKLREYTKGQGVDVVYDSVGKDTFMDSLDCLKRFGMMVSYGNASGPVPAFEPLLLSRKGSLYLTRPTVMHHIEDEGEYRANAAELFDLVEKNILKIRIDRTLPLAEAAHAHRLLESRQTTGAIVLVNR